MNAPILNELEVIDVDNSYLLWTKFPTEVLELCLQDVFICLRTNRCLPIGQLGQAMWAQALIYTYSCWMCFSTFFFCTNLYLATINNFVFENVSHVFDVQTYIFMQPSILVSALPWTHASLRELIFISWQAVW